MKDKKYKKNKKGKLIVIVAPSGAGKSTLIKKLKGEFPEIKESISHTTRSIRAGEKDGINYYFTAEDEFKQKIQRGEFLEWAKVHSHYYGTSHSFVENMLDQGEIILFDIDVQGADAFKKACDGDYGDACDIIDEM